WVRGACLYGIMPANGMIYNPPHPCACYLEAKLYGFNALAGTSASRRVPRKVPQESRLERGPAYGKVAAEAKSAEDWPTYRHDAARSGYTETSVPVKVGPKWHSQLGGRLSSPVVAEGKVFIASVDTHQIYALDADLGVVAWSYITGGRVDSPPTVWKGRVLFGSADGYVYCLRASESDGALVWRFRAAPMDRRMCSFEQLESVWPVHGSVLIRAGELWCVAGRSMFVDGGLRLLRLNPVTGRLINERILDDTMPDSGDNLQVLVKGLNMPVALPDILSADDKYVYMRSQRFDFDGVRHELGICSARQDSWTTFGGIGRTGCTAECGNPAREDTLKPVASRPRAGPWYSTTRPYTDTGVSLSTTAGQHRWSINFLPRRSSPSVLVPRMRDDRSGDLSGRRLGIASLSTGPKMSPSWCGQWCWQTTRCSSPGRRMWLMRNNR
ncbi:MAG: outer membrane protein assembly factor BamB family protein, partial [Planctomycetota bacterium]